MTGRTECQPGIVEQIREMCACTLQGYHDPMICAVLRGAADRIEELTKALRKIAGHDEYGPHDHAAAAAYRREEGVWTTAEYLADRALSLPLEDRKC